MSEEEPPPRMDEASLALIVVGVLVCLAIIGTGSAFAGYAVFVLVSTLVAASVFWLSTRNRRV